MTAPAIGVPAVKLQNKIVVAIAWSAMALLSSLPNIVVRELFGRGSVWLFRGKIVLLVVALLACFAVAAVRPLRGFFLAFLALYTAEWAANWFAQRGAWAHSFSGTFPRSMLGSQLLKLWVALVMVGVVLAIVRSLRASFLRLAAPGATVTPEWFLPIRRPVSYSRFGPPLALAIGIGTLGFVLLAGRPSLSVLRLALPLLPLVLLLAATLAQSSIPGRCRRSHSRIRNRPNGRGCRNSRSQTPPS